MAAAFDWIMVDLKEPRAARLAAEAIAGLDPNRFIFASTEQADLRTVRSALPLARTSLSFPRDPWPARALRGAYLQTMRLALPALIALRVRRHRPDQLTLNHRYVTLAALRMARRFRRPVYVWTVDEPERARWLAAHGVTGIITNRPLAIAAALADV